jgi:hypothetical protein
MIVRMETFQQVTATLGGSFFTDFVISGNSAFDPFQALGSVQPSGYDQWAAIYNEYRVLRSRVKFQMVAADATTSTVLTAFRLEMAIAPKNVSSSFGSFADLTSTQYSTKLSVDGSLGRPVPLQSRWMSLAQMFGYSSAEFDYDASAAVTANPVDEWFWHLGAELDQKAGTGDTAITFGVTVEYEVEFFARDSLGLSLEEKLVHNRKLRSEYLRLKAMTPGQTGRLPPKPSYLEQLKASLSGLEDTGSDDFYQVETKDPKSRTPSLASDVKDLLIGRSGLPIQVHPKNQLSIDAGLGRGPTSVGAQTPKLCISTQGKTTVVSYTPLKTVDKAGADKLPP